MQSYKIHGTQNIFNILWICRNQCIEILPESDEFVKIIRKLFDYSRKSKSILIPIKVTTQFLCTKDSLSFQVTN